MKIGPCHEGARLNFKYLSEGKGAMVTARFGADGITICDPNSLQVFQRIYEKPI